MLSRASASSATVASSRFGTTSSSGAGGPPSAEGAPAGTAAPPFLSLSPFPFLSLSAVGGGVICACASSSTGGGGSRVISRGGVVISALRQPRYLQRGSSSLRRSSITPSTVTHSPSCVWPLFLIPFPTRLISVAERSLMRSLMELLSSNISECFFLAFAFTASIASIRVRSAQWGSSAPTNPSYRPSLSFSVAAWRSSMSSATSFRARPLCSITKSSRDRTSSIFSWA
mmetsp:Transcript_6711/g.13625  ORF Transcript_6711/g.13625 Transcript_6711/m.13625 type:complete len:229 (+) Transcript_6711:1151-1837(+)